MRLDWKMDKNWWKLQEAETQVLWSTAAERDLNSTRYSVLVKYNRYGEDARTSLWTASCRHIFSCKGANKLKERLRKKSSKTSIVFTGSRSRSQLSLTSSVVAASAVMFCRSYQLQLSLIMQGCGWVGPSWCMWSQQSGRACITAAVPINNQHQQDFQPRPEKSILSFNRSNPNDV